MSSIEESVGTGQPVPAAHDRDGEHAAARGGRQWIIQPLLDAGLPVEELSTMLFDVACAAMGGDGELDTSLREAVVDRPAPVQAAWMEVIDRMITSPIG